MLQASLHGKLPSKLERSEDVLTSNVLGMFEFLSTPGLILSILRESTNSLNQRIPLPFTDTKARYFFWTPLDHCEPDVLIYLEGESEAALILIEAKYHSGKSSIEDENIPPEESYDAVEKGTGFIAYIKWKWLEIL